MSLLHYVKKIHTECDSIGNPVLNVKAIKIDGDGNSLKNSLGCSNLKSFDYFKRSKRICYFIEISDFHRELEDCIANGMPVQNSEKHVKEGIRLKIAETLLIYREMINKYNVTSSKVDNTKVLLISCKNDMSSSIALDFLSRNLEQHYKPIFCETIKILPYSELENVF